MALSSSLLLADAAPAPVRPYDYDLFSKDRECEFIDIEALCFKLLNNQPVGMLNDSPASQTPIGGVYDSGVSSRIKNMNWKWRPGVRVSVGYFNAPKYWEVMGQYTWFQDTGTRSIINPSSSESYLRTGGYLPADFTSSTLQPIIVGQGNPILLSIQANAQLDYNDLSTLVTRNFYPNPHLRLKVVGGLTSMWAHQTTDIQNTFSGMSETLDYRFHSKYWGIGFKMGTTADWYWGKDFYLTGKVFWSIVTGRWNTNTKVASSTGTLYTQPYDSAYLTTQNFNFIFGPSYQKSYEKMRWELFVGYEFNSWLDALVAYNYQQTQESAWANPQTFFQDLTLTGVNIRLTLDF
jgi:hypothetical protein